MDPIKRFYDLVAQETADAWYGKDSLLPTIKEFIALLPQHPRVLDVGCGPGHESKRIADCGAHVVGLDFSEASIKIAREKNPSLSFYVMDMRALDSKLGMFDGIFACASLIHISYDEIDGVIRSLAAMVKPAGIVAAIILDGSEKSVMVHYINDEKIERTLYLYSKEQLVTVFEKYGFCFVQEGYIDSALSTPEWRWKNYIFKKMR